MKRPAAALVILLAASASACHRHDGNATPTPAPSPVAAGSGQVKLALAKSGCDQDQEDCVCKGSVDDAAGLKDLGLSADDLAAGVVCFSGDFDGNGSKDWAITGKGYFCDPDGGKDVTTKLRVLLVDHDKLAHAETIDALDCASAVPVDKGDYEGVTSDRDGLEGNVGDAQRLWYWDGAKMTSVADDTD